MACVDCAMTAVDATSSLFDDLSAFGLLFDNDTASVAIMAPAAPAATLALTLNWKSSFDTAIVVR